MRALRQLLSGLQQGTWQIAADAPIGGPQGNSPGLTSFLDTGGDATGGPDNYVAPIDAVLVINWLNAFPAVGGEGEGSLAAAGPVPPEASQPDRASPLAIPAARQRLPDLSALIGLLASDHAAQPRRRSRR